MTPDELFARLGHSLSGLDPARLLDEVERTSEARPTDRSAAALLADVHAYATATDGVPPIVRSVRREGLVRWDEHSVTFDGTDVHTGRATRVRVLRPHAAADPVLRRALLRDGKALRDVLGTSVLAWDGPEVALTCELGGTALSTPETDDEVPGRPLVLVRALATALQALAHAEARGVGFPPLSRRELVEGRDGAVHLACLTPTPLPSDGAQVARLAEAVTAWWGDGPETPVDALLSGFVTFPPRTASDALRWLNEALKEHLVGERHALVQRHERIAADLARERLVDLVGRLGRALPPPAGQGAVAVDLEGASPALVGDGATLVWGDEPVYADGALAVRAARRLVRIRAASPVTGGRLGAAATALHGDQAFVDAACRWTASSLTLRTVRLMLESRNPGAR